MTLARFHLDVEPTDTFRSVLFFPGDRRPFAAGPRAIDLYLEEHAEGQSSGRLIQSVKSLLASRLFTKTQISGRRYNAEDLVTLIVRALRTEAQAQLGEFGPRVVVGRPVRFVGAENEEDEEMALTRLRAALATAGFPRVTFEYEPVGAAYFYESRLDHDELILIADFGGGTSDFSLMPVGPSLRAGKRKRTILGTEGMPLAGDAFDARMVRHVVSPLLGEGSGYRSLRKVLPVPGSVYRKLERWHHLSFLKSPDTMRMLQSVEAQALEPEKISKLIALVENDLGLQLHRAVQRTKFELSVSGESRFAFHHPMVSIEQLVTRAQFENWIADYLEAIGAAVDRLLAATRVPPGEIDRVFLTGGTSLVPSVRALFERRFGPERISAGDEFTSVAKGLAFRAADLE
ncbi:MAG: putative heat shock protein YegD [Bryobacterales bacterium]|nr:putative heat shock protein YegD [Bryobacterales bacterium]